MTLRIALDATSLLDVRTGVGTFTAALLDGLARRPGLEVTAFPVSVRGRRRLSDVVPEGVRVVAPPLPARLVRRAWRLADRPRVDRFVGRHDVVHGPNFVVPPTAAGRLATVHDLTSVRYPEMCRRDVLAYPGLIRRAADRGAWFHTPSEAVRAELLDHFPVDPGRVVAVPNGFHPMTGGDAARGRALAGRDDYVLAVGTVEPRKDLPGLVDAVGRLAASGTEVPLVHVGPDGWGTAELERALASMSRPELVTRLGPRSGRDLADLYRGARLFAYPSVYEGFGIPVLEAMSADVPVVTTAVPAVVEVAGGAAEVVAVGDVDALAEAIGRVWTDEHRRAELVSAGRDRVGRYSWEACVDGIVGLYGRVRDSD